MIEYFLICLARIQSVRYPSELLRSSFSHTVISGSILATKLWSVLYFDMNCFILSVSKSVSNHYSGCNQGLETPQTLCRRYSVQEASSGARLDTRASRIKCSFQIPEAVAVANARDCFGYLITAMVVLNNRATKLNSEKGPIGCSVPPCRCNHTLHISHTHTSIVLKKLLMICARHINDNMQ